jgi:hypothetical protein
LSVSNLFILIGAALLALGIYTYFRQRANLAQSILTDGIVIELIPKQALGEFIWKRTGKSVKIEKKYCCSPGKQPVSPSTNISRIHEFLRKHSCIRGPSFINGSSLAPFRVFRVFRG